MQYHVVQSKSHQCQLCKWKFVKCFWKYKESRYQWYIGHLEKNLPTQMILKSRQENGEKKEGTWFWVDD